jgi:hypothetical protein
MIGEAATFLNGGMVASLNKTVDCPYISLMRGEAIRASPLSRKANLLRCEGMTYCLRVSLHGKTLRKLIDKDQV